MGVTHLLDARTSCGRRLHDLGDDPHLIADVHAVDRKERSAMRLGHATATLCQCLNGFRSVLLYHHTGEAIGSEF